MPEYDRSLWRPAPRQPGLGADDVHVWRACLMQPDARVLELVETLSEDERHRAERYRFVGDKRRFIVARGLLRRILRCYLEIPAAQIRFSYGIKGKPALALPGCTLQFNLSHSREVVLIALTLRRDIGIDLELVRSLAAMDQMAERFFSAHEKQMLGVLAPLERQETFFRFWACKEAYIKACGKGLALALDQFDVAIEPDGGVSLLANRQERDAHPGHWAIRQIEPGKNYVAAVAVGDAAWNLRCWQWQDDHFNWEEDCHQDSCQTYDE
ncbi:4'-phosphopantetheinyl transferase family protein [Gloeobacter violaceus]|uniref:Glr2851 protein n=1 Tax=Gloeobacter violaceus (strain ATCC 29082 / PCC 7421) TaxID=251221 RepID=Q7NCX5_GLOVI|nr:4'-phosphopantetheinyl transferase superfamily protein [Gloeobacter violaceus]BAC90792.1 glr2851 [Gloeobacter violaceus PCC 7421]